MAEPEQTHAIPRDLLEKYFKDDPRLISAFENQALAVMEVTVSADGTVAATDSMQAATVVTLSTNASFANEFVLGPGDGTEVVAATGTVSIKVDASVARTNNQAVMFNAPGAVSLGLPNLGTLLSDYQPRLPTLVDAVDQAAAAAAGVPLWGIYRDGNDLKIRNV